MADAAKEFAGLVSAMQHRNVFRGKNLGTSVTAAQKAAIQNGTFDDLFIGDYWVINGVNWTIADMDYWYNCGDTAFTRHHLVIIPGGQLYSAKMNDTNTTEGGYFGSKMRGGEDGVASGIDALDRLAEEEIQKQEALTKLEQQAKKAEKKLDAVVPVVQDAETFARNNISYFEDLIPEAGALESAKSYREHKIMPLVQKLKEKFLGLYRMILDLKKSLESLQKRLSKAERDRDHYKEQLEKEQEKCGELQQDSDDLHRVRRAFGSERIDVIIASERQQEAEIEAQRKAAEQQQKLARKRHERDAR